MAKSRSYCSECGAALDVDARFCTECGTPVVSEETAATERTIVPDYAPKASPRQANPPLRPAIHPPRAHSEQRRPDAPPPPAKLVPPPPAQPRSGPAAVETPKAGNKSGSLISNIIVLALVWGLTWAISGSIALAITGSGFFLNLSLAKMVAGLVAGSLAGVVLSMLYSGVSAVGAGRLVFLAVFWIGAETLTLAAWNGLGISSPEDILALTLVYGSVFGLLYAISMQARKPGWAFPKVPIAASLLAFCAVAGRAVQFALYYI